MPRLTTGTGKRSRKSPLPAGSQAKTEPRLLQVESEEPLAVSAPQESSEPKSFRWLWYLLSLAMPFAGVVIGIFLYDHDSRSVRLIGRNSLLIGFVVWVLMPLALILLVALLGAVAAMDWIANIVPPGS
jgi:hypothetical protein